MSVSEAILAAEAAAQKLREELEVLEREAKAELGFCPRAVTQLVERHQQTSLRGVRRAIAEAQRPKGPVVMLEFSDAPYRVISVEVVRRTPAVVVLRADGGQEFRHRIANGRPEGRHSSVYGYWLIREADLEAIRAMPVGENAVSRALKAIEAGRYDEVKA